MSKPWNRTELLACVRQAFDTFALRVKNQQLTEVVQRQNVELAELNRGLERQVQERTSNLLDGMIAVLDYRDTETQWHSRRVSRFTCRIAQALGVTDPNEMRTIEMGSLLHDIGKIGVRDAVLLKPGPLNPSEWAEMREHPRLGWALLQRIEFLRGASQIVLQHQERWDGNGYPSKLKGEEIVLGARLFAVADTYDAITSDRPYRKAQSHEAAIAEIRRVAGTQLDPRGAEAFCALPEIGAAPHPRRGRADLAARGAVGLDSAGARLRCLPRSGGQARRGGQGGVEPDPHRAPGRADPRLEPGLAERSPRVRPRVQGARKNQVFRYSVSGTPTSAG